MRFQYIVKLVVFVIQFKFLEIRILQVEIERLDRTITFNGSLERIFAIKVYF